jgi:hypothetical protein
MSELGLGQVVIALFEGVCLLGLVVTLARGIRR